MSCDHVFSEPSDNLEWNYQKARQQSKPQSPLFILLCQPCWTGSFEIKKKKKKALPWAPNLPLKPPHPQLSLPVINWLSQLTDVRTDLLKVSSTVVLADHPSGPLAEVEVEHGDHATEAFGQRLGALQQHSSVCEDAPGPQGWRGFHRVAMFAFRRRCSGGFQIRWDQVFFGFRDKNFGIL